MRMDLAVDCNLFNYDLRTGIQTHVLTVLLVILLLIQLDGRGKSWTDLECGRENLWKLNIIQVLG